MDLIELNHLPFDDNIIVSGDFDLPTIGSQIQAMGLDPEPALDLAFPLLPIFNQHREPAACRFYDHTFHLHTL